jgi:hypothetical protein
MTDEERLAWAVRPEDPGPLPVIERPPPVPMFSPPLPETGEQLLERLRAKGVVRELGTADPPAWIAPSQRLTIVERDGRETVIELDAYDSRGYLSVEYWLPKPNAPWEIWSRSRAGSVPRRSRASRSRTSSPTRRLDPMKTCCGRWLWPRRVGRASTRRPRPA